MKPPLRPGIYDLLVTGELAKYLSDESEFRAELAKIQPGEAPEVLGRFLGERISEALREAKPQELEHLIKVANRFLILLSTATGGERTRLDAQHFVTPQRLLSFSQRDPLSSDEYPLRPSTPLSQSALFVNARDERSVGDEIIRELATADQVDLLCAFLVWSGFLRVRDAIYHLRRQRDRPFRVITTVYCGATERRVVDELVRLGAEVKVSYDTRRTRLHAKAWLMRRNTGFSTAFIGSSNLSAAALTDGVEWNVRLGRDNEPLLRKFAAMFDSYWSDPSYESYDPTRDAERFDAAVGASRVDPTPLEVALVRAQPYDYQQRILDRLAAERHVHDRWKNLVVAATGTGKTVIAAFDFARLRPELQAFLGRPPRLLFVAHRKEILVQSLSTFRHVLREPRFGGLLVDGERPSTTDAVFASVQSLAQIPIDSIASDAFDVLIVDEFHHAEAPTYTRWLEHLRPRVLLGLTATPERMDGADITRWFDGSSVIELRLWEAIDRGLLVPFQYFGLKDEADATPFWKRGRIDLEALGQFYSGHHIRAQQILREVREHVSNPRAMRALGFCASVQHAEFMARMFTEHGLPSRALSGSSEDRFEVVKALRDGLLSAVFTVDLFNEGVDIPEADTVLFLRPTESATLFLQQLGRGLRLCEGKRNLVVLDFIAEAGREFRFDVRYRALVGGSRKQIEHQLEEGFPVLPAGCSIQLSDDARDIVLRSLKQALSTRSDRLLQELRRLGPTTSLATFLDETGIDLGDLYANGRSMTSLRRRAGFLSEPKTADEEPVCRRLVGVLHLDDPGLLDSLLLDLASEGAPPDHGSQWRMILTPLFPEDGATQTVQALQRLWQSAPVLRELSELLTLLRSRVDHEPIPLRDLDVPLQIHCRYSRDQIMAAFGAIKNGKLDRPREGVWFDERTKADLFFVTLTKTEEEYSPSTMYEDYIMSATQFHWQTQASTTLESRKGQRNVRHRELGITPLLFVRKTKRDENGETMPYVFLGPVSIESYQGEKPISIVWNLQHPMPADFHEENRVAV